MFSLSFLVQKLAESLHLTLYW